MTNDLFHIFSRYIIQYWWSEQGLNKAIVPTIWKPGHSKSDIFVWISDGFWQNCGHLSGFQMVGLLDFRSHLKSGPFETQPLFDQSKSRLVWISDPHCTHVRFLDRSSLTVLFCAAATFTTFLGEWNERGHKLGHLEEGRLNDLGTFKSGIWQTESSKAQTFH